MYIIFKRALDIFLSIVSMVILLPLIIPIVIGLRFTGEGYVFYFQERIGFKNKKFKIWKFSTMLKDSPNMLTGSLTLRDDPRLTPMGSFLRKTKINELPQVVNVLLGDMSIVGPRPQMQEDYNCYPKEIQEVIFDVLPGITGVGSILFRDEERFLSNTDLEPHEFYKQHIAPYKGALEIWYQQHASLSSDLKIIFLTAWAIFFPKSNLLFNVFKDLPKPPPIFSNPNSKSSASVEKSVSNLS